MPLAKARLIKGVAIAGATLCVAGVSGVLMERHSRQVAAEQAAEARTPAPQPAVQEATAAALPAAPAPEVLPEADALPLQDIELTSSPVILPESDPSHGGFGAEAQLVQAQATDQAADPAAPEGEAGAEVANDCPVTLTAEPAAAAMVTLTLDAPCYAEDRVAFHHEGMVFSELTDAEGALTLSVPALAEYAIFVAVFQDGEGASAEAEVSSLAFYDRSVVQWQGETGLELHALEYGANYDDSGHVWAETPRDVSVAARGEGGFLTVLGNADLPQARLAQVYSFPLGIARQAGTIDLSVEAQVTEANCGREITAQVIHVSEGAFGSFHDLNVTMPACDAAGDYLLLKNLLDDLKIAAK